MMENEIIKIRICFKIPMLLFSMGDSGRGLLGRREREREGRDTVQYWPTLDI